MCIHTRVLKSVLGLFRVALTLWGAGFAKDPTKGFCGIASLE